jgi:hypothetical protein
MGEYATRKSDGQYVKIGTCESMYYLRWEDRNKVRVDGGYSLDEPGLSFRLPFPDEAHMLPGDIGDNAYNRGHRLSYWRDPEDATKIEPFTMKGAEEHPGTIQLHHASGLLLNVPCYHGTRLPDAGKIRAFWNGKDLHVWELVRVKNQPGEGLLPLVQCRHCGQVFRTTWAHVLNHISDEQLKDRLIEYAAAAIPA